MLDLQSSTDVSVLESSGCSRSMSPAILSTTARLTTSQLVVKTKLDLFQHAGVIWMLVNEYGLEENDSKILFEDMKRFLFAAYIVSEEMNLVPSNRVDLAWHCFLLHTRDYMNFCNNMFGQILHHEPINGRVDASKCGCCDSSCGITREGETDPQNFATPEDTMKVIMSIFGQQFSGNWTYTKMQKSIK